MTEIHKISVRYHNKAYNKKKEILKTTLYIILLTPSNTQTLGVRSASVNNVKQKALVFVFVRK